jgi:hypothetical protein
MEEVQRIQEALQKGEFVLSDSQVELIKHHTTILGEDGEAAMREIQKKAMESVCLPADIVRVIDSYCKDLTRRVGLRELSNDLEKDKEHERLVQLEAMEAEVSKFKVAKAQGNMADLMRVKGAPSAQLKKYVEDIEANEEDCALRRHREMEEDCPRPHEGCNGVFERGRQGRGGQRRGCSRPPEAGNREGSQSRARL